MSKATTIHAKVSEIFSPERERAISKALDKAPTREAIVSQVTGDKKAGSKK